MQEIRGDMFSPDTYAMATGEVFRSHGGIIMPVPEPNAMCITTNCFVKRNGEAVMGRGCARRASQLMPGLPGILGSHYAQGMHHVLAHGPWNGIEVVSFPVKPESAICHVDRSNVVRHMRRQFKHPQKVPGWACVAQMSIIEQSAMELVELTDDRNWQYVVLPRPGCGCGELLWSDVKPLLDQYLDDRFMCITY